MNLGTIALKIRAAALSEFGNRVLGTVEFALAQEYTVKEETAFVIPLAEGVNGENQYDTSVNQMVKERFGVVVALKNDAEVAKKLGLAAFDRLHGVRTKLFRAMLGWIPAGTEMPVYYMGGRVLDINPAWLWYQFEFQQETHITNSADGIDPTLGPWDDFMRVYTQWLIGDVSQAILPMTGAPPLLPETMQPPDISTVIDFHYAYSSAFGTGLDTLDAEAAK